MNPLMVPVLLFGIMVFGAGKFSTDPRDSLLRDEVRHLKAERVTGTSASGEMLHAQLKLVVGPHW